MGFILDGLASGIYRKIAIVSVIACIFLGTSLGVQSYRLKIAKEKIIELETKLTECRIDLNSTLWVFRSMDPQMEGLKKYADKISEICKEIIKGMGEEPEQ